MRSTVTIEDEWKELVAEADALAAAATALRRTTRLLARPDGYDSLPKVARALDGIEKATALPESLRDRAADAARSARTWLDAEREIRARGFAREAVEHFRARGVGAVQDGLEISAPPCGIRFDPARDRAEVHHAGEPVIEGVPLVPERIFAAWQSAQARLAAGETPPERFADLLIGAYDRIVARDREGRAGPRVPLPEVHFEMFVGRQTAQARTSPTQGRIKEYPRFQFAWDLARLLDSPEFHARGARRIEILPASPSASKSRSASVLVVGEDGERRVLGDVRVG
ncbi:hypothetical protein L6R50_14190 [Myxococcota bacterium]|nr:hypothetical protein [Myxococcota bacterium]